MLQRMKPLLTVSFIPAFPVVAGKPFPRDPDKTRFDTDYNARQKCI